MHSGPQKDPDQFGLDERSVEELKEKAVAAKERAYCRFCLSVCLSVYVLRLDLCCVAGDGVKETFLFGLRE